MSFIKHVKQGEIIPAWYGLSWHSYERNEALCIVMPFNIIASVFRSIYIWMRHGYKPVHSNPRDAYHQGLKEK